VNDAPFRERRKKLLAADCELRRAPPRKIQTTITIPAHLASALTDPISAKKPQQDEVARVYNALVEWSGLDADALARELKPGSAWVMLAIFLAGNLLPCFASTRQVSRPGRKRNQTEADRDDKWLVETINQLQSEYRQAFGTPISPQEAWKRYTRKQSPCPPALKDLKPGYIQKRFYLARKRLRTIAAFTQTLHG